MPLAGDVAQFSNVGPSWTDEIAYAMTHALNPTPHSANVGAVEVLSSRVTRDLQVTSNSGSASTFFYHGATVNGVAHTIISNQSARHYTHSHSGGGQATLALTNHRDSVVQIGAAGNVTLNLRIGASGVNNGARLVLQGSGSGTLTLSGVGNFYSGGTRIVNGTLVLASANAAGTGAIVNEAGALRLNVGLSLTNAVTLGTAAATYRRDLNAAQGYDGYRAGSAAGARQLNAALIGGSAAVSQTLTGSFDTVSVALNDDQRISDTFSLTRSGDLNEVFVLSLAGPLEPGATLSWLDGDGLWVNAIEGNSASGSLAQTGLLVSFADSGLLASADYLGSWGYDPLSDSHWAILDHDGTFTLTAAAVPEPGAFALLGGAAGLLLWRRRRSVAVVA